MTTKHVLYRHYDADGLLLYVGITHDPGKRWQQHRGDKNWWDEVAITKLEHFGSRQEVLNAEKKAIVSERPRWNMMHNADGRAYWQRVEDAVENLLDDLPFLAPALLEGVMEPYREAYRAAFDRELRVIFEYEEFQRTGELTTDPGWYHRECTEAEERFKNADDPVGFGWNEQGALDGTALTSHTSEWEVKLADFYPLYKRGLTERGL